MTREERQEIVDLHVEEHGGFDSRHFGELARSPDHPAHEYIYPEGWEQRAKKWWVSHRVVQFVSDLRYEVEIVERDIVTVVDVPALVADLRINPGTGGRYVHESEDGYLEALTDQARRHMRTALERYARVMTATDLKVIGRMIRRWTAEVAK